MASRRRMARAGLDRPQVGERDEPGWLHRFVMDDWVDETARPPVYLDDSAPFWRGREAVRRWKRARAEWYEQQGLPQPEGPIRGGQNHELAAYLNRCGWPSKL